MEKTSDLARLAEQNLIKINQQIEIMEKIKAQFQLIRQRLIEQALSEGHTRDEIEATLQKIEEGDGKNPMEEV